MESNDQAMSSMTFVISAAYTVTFANSIYLMSVKDENVPFSISNMQFCVERALCGCFSLIMTLRYFFGNNQYLDGIMKDQQRSARARFYHFGFVAVQSVILVVSSYSIRNTWTFISCITLLFAIEVIWYLGALIVDVNGMWMCDRNVRNGFLLTEATNVGFVLGVMISRYCLSRRPNLCLAFIVLFFLWNSAIDLVCNLESYMGTI